ncbi:MAG: acetylxylan esterase [Tannerella sp.]|nr:acetylxylan esterase [Tannerella sp.]
MLPFVHAQKEDFNVYDYWNYYGDMSNNLYEQLYAVAAEQVNRRKLQLSGLKTKDDWTRYQSGAKEKLQKTVGQFPAKTPLNPVITGKIKRDGFIVEKLYFESRPGYYVTAALFVPAGGKGKKPAILYCSGHSENGFRSDDYQTSIMNLVKKGFVVLAFDPVGQGERIQYLDGNGQAVFGPTHEHSYPGTQSFISGMPPANYFIWDGIRAIDYLLGRKEVDSQRIGITGRSGGGTQCACIAAVDDRIVASAPECYLTTFDMLLRSRGPQDAEQILMYALEEGFDISDLIAVRAPKPVLMITTTRDIFSIQGARDVFNENRAAYAAYGQPENLLMAEDDEEHVNTKKNREALHAFFQKHLGNPGSPEDEAVELFDEKDLWVTPAGQIQKYLPSETLFSLNEKQATAMLERLQAKRALSYPAFLKDLRQTAVRMTGYRKPAATAEFIFSGRWWRNGYAIEKYLVKGSGNYFIPLLRLLPAGDAKETVLLLDDRGKSVAVNEGLADGLVQEGFEVIVPDLNGIGELGGGYSGGDARIQDTPMNVWYAGILTRKTPLALRVEETGLLLDFINAVNDRERVVTGLSCGTLGAELLHAAAIENRFDRIVLLHPLYSFSSLVRERNYRTRFVMSAVPGVTGEYDLPDLCAAIAPRKTFLINPLNALDEKVDADLFNATYAIVKDRFTQTGHPQNFTVNTDAQDILREILRWLNR